MTPSTTKPGKDDEQGHSVPAVCRTLKGPWKIYVCEECGRTETGPRMSQTCGLTQYHRHGSRVEMKTVKVAPVSELERLQERVEAVREWAEHMLEIGAVENAARHVLALLPEEEGT